MPLIETGVVAPSGVELFVDGVQRYTDAASPGSLLLTDLPVTTGANSFRMVLTDPTGRTREVDLSFYASNRLLAPGLSDFSVEAGAVRENFGVKSLEYGEPFVSGTYRRGLTSTITGELHGEANADLVQVGGTVYAAAWNALLIGVAAAYSDGPAGAGHMVAGTIERDGPVFSASVSYINRSPEFQDVAVLAGQPIARQTALASMSLRIGDNQVLNATYILQDRGELLGKAELVSATYTQSFFNHRLRFDLSGFADLTDREDWGVNLTMSFPIGRNSIATVGGGTRPEASNYYVAANGDAFNGDLTWRGRYMGGDGEAADIGAVWRTRRATLAARALRVQESDALQLELRQSLVLFDSRVFLSRRIDDAFTVVDVEDSPGVEVFLENQTMGRTGKDGRLFVNDLRGYEANALSIDPAGLPASAAAKTFSAIVAPRSGGGVVTRFAVDQRRAAVIILRRPDGAAPPVGARVVLDGAPVEAVLGYGGETYLRGLPAGANAVTVSWAGESCRATFKAPETGGALARIEATPCQ